MNKPASRPAPIARYLDRIRRGLVDLPAEYRDEVLAGIAEHADDRLADGDTPNAVIASLGGSGAVIAQAIEQHEAQGDDRPARWLTPRRAAQLLALALAVLTAGFVAFLIPAFQETVVTSVTETGSGGPLVTDSTTVRETVPISVYEWVGPLALVGISLPIVLTGIPLLARGRAGRPVAIACTALLAVFTVIASATVGWFFLPALIAAVVAVFLPDRGAASG